MVSVHVTGNMNGGFAETIFGLPDGRAIVTTNTPGDWAALFHSRTDWEQANTPDDAVREYDSVADAFADVI